MDSAEHARSFGDAAAAYARARPGYPDDAVGFCVAGARGPGTRVLDLGAGTGKATAALVARDLDVVAVEPSTRMLAQLRAALPGVQAHEGTAEATGLPAGSVDAVVVAQAWHWVDPVRAVPEVVRVLRPGGTLGLVWNTRDDSVGWVRDVWSTAQLGLEREQAWDGAHPGGGFGPAETFETGFVHVTDRAGILDLIASRSYVIVLPPDERAGLLREVAAVLDTHPDLRGRDEVRLPYRTRCHRFTLGG